MPCLAFHDGSSSHPILYGDGILRSMLDRHHKQPRSTGHDISVYTSLSHVLLLCGVVVEYVNTAM